jgi:hypothetical protein
MKKLLYALPMCLMLALVACSTTQSPEQPRTPQVSITSTPTPAVPTVHAISIENVERVFSSAVDVTLRPPTTEGIYELVSPEASIPDGGTRMLFAHAVGPNFDGPPGPGNLWEALQPDDRVIVEGVGYQVTAIEETSKTWSEDLRERAYAPVPGRLLLITCIPLEQGGTATSNRVIWTQRVE